MNFKFILAVLLCLFVTQAHAVKRAPSPPLAITYTGGYGQLTGQYPLDIMHTYGRFYGVAGRTDSNVLYVKNISAPKIVTVLVQEQVFEYNPSDGIAGKWVYYDVPFISYTGCGYYLNTSETCIVYVTFTPPVSGFYTSYVVRVFFNITPDLITEDTIASRIYQLDATVF